MGHLVKPIPNNGVAISLQQCRQLLVTLHNYLAQQGQYSLTQASAYRELGFWGTGVKRVKVRITKAAVGKDAEDYLYDRGEHNLIEVINQCATMERLIDLLAWLETGESPFSDYLVANCHPTTSSRKTRIDSGLVDNDLVLIAADGGSARFEVSDLVGDKDGNAKEEKDLNSLDVTNRLQPQTLWRTGGERDRRFLVVSSKFAERLTKPKRKWVKGTEPILVYSAVTSTSGGTVVMEVRPGSGYDAWFGQGGVQ